VIVNRNYKSTMTKVSLNKGFILSSGFSTYVSMTMTKVSLNKGFILSSGFSTYVSIGSKSRRPFHLK
jgi:hypothetical protein